MLNAEYGLAELMREDAPAVALAFLDRILVHPATEHSTRNRARSLRQVLIAVDSGAAASTQHRPTVSLCF